MGEFKPVHRFRRLILGGVDHDAVLNITSLSEAVAGLRIKLIPGQTGNPVEIRNSSNALVSGFASSGGLFANNLRAGQANSPGGIAGNGGQWNPTITWAPGIFDGKQHPVFSGWGDGSNGQDPTAIGILLTGITATSASFSVRNKSAGFQVLYMSWIILRP